MRKKILLGLLAAVVVVGGVAGMSAYEAHVINVTAKIENAMGVSTDSIEFGTVFPQEYLERGFTVRLSQSFLAEDQLRMADVQYKIVQKPKCECIYEYDDPLLCPSGQYAAVDYATHECPVNEDGIEAYVEMEDLCRFLSKMCVECDNDVGVPSYYDGSVPECSDPASHIATGYMVKCHPDNEPCLPGDVEDCWKVDLKVPPVEGYIGQDWPASCAGYAVPTDSETYGCDLWIEVTGFSVLPAPFCGDGFISGNEECEYDEDCLFYPDQTCVDCVCVPPIII